VVVTDQAGSVTSVAAQLTVVPVDQATNLLVNRGFETGADFPWTRFNGGGLATTNNLYYQTADPVEVRSGLYVSQTYGNGPGSYNGLFQDAPASPGQGFVADGWFLLAAQDALTGASEGWLEVQFMNANDGMLALYKSDYITTNGFPSNTWVNLKATNMIAFWGDYSVVGQANYLIAPENTAKVRYQVTFHAMDGGGSIWYDDMRLLLKQPVTVTTQRSGNDLSLSFATQIGVSYEVRYKTDLADAEWQLLTTVTGDGNIKTISDPVGATKRFYRVTTL
ncbi:MAG TPA: hypothetical protein VN673_07645, partial [Clostridia bacterium]|nr:hypothetical protein [Clostridia bacterium]